MLSGDSKAALSVPYDGDFNGLPSSGPFSWSLSEQGGALLAFEEPPDEANGKALYVEADSSFSTETVISQILVLPAGPYELTGRELLTDQNAGGRLSWEIHCIGGGAQGAAPTNIDRDEVGRWRTFSIRFEHNVDCPAHLLKLRVSPGEGPRPSAVWYDDFRVHSLREKSPSIAAAGPS